MPRTNKNPFTQKERYKIIQWYKNNPDAAKLRDQRRQTLRLQAQENVRKRKHDQQNIDEAELTQELQHLTDIDTSNWLDDTLETDIDKILFQAALEHGVVDEDVLDKLETDIGVPKKKSKSSRGEEFTVETQGEKPSTNKRPSTCHTQACEDEEEEHDAGLYLGHKKLKQQSISDPQQVENKTVIFIATKQTDFIEIVINSLYKSKLTTLKKTKNILIIQNDNYLKQSDNYQKLKNNKEIDHYQIHYLPKSLDKETCIRVVEAVNVQNVNS